jgi:large subunit ribosomal protein L29
MKAREMRDMPDHEITDQLAELRRELLQLRLSNATGQLEDTSKLPRTRRQLARTLTVARERGVAATTGGGAR